MVIKTDDNQGGHSSLLSLKESKADQQKLIDYVGEDTAKLFFTLKNRLKSPENDIYYWLKKSPDELEDRLNQLQSTQTRKEKEGEASKGAELIYNKDGWKVYHITTYEASVKYGKNTQWCISGSKRWSNGERGEEYFNDYTSKGVEFYFYIKSNDEKYALAYTPQNGNYQVFNQVDNEVFSEDLLLLPNVDGLPRFNYDDILSEDGTFIYEGGNIPSKLRDKIKRVEVSDSVTKIATNAFYECTSLTSVNISDSVTKIGDGTFANCKSLTSINIPDSVTEISSCAFYKCVSLTSINIPDSVTYIGSLAFHGCESLIIYTDNDYAIEYCEENNVLHKPLSKTESLTEASRKDLRTQSQKGSPKRYAKRLNYYVSNFKGVDLAQLFEHDYFVFNTPIKDYICTLAFPGVLTKLRDNVKSTNGDPKRINLRMVIQALREAFDATDDVKVRCTCPDFCLTGDTEIELLEGKSIKMEDLLKEFESGRQDLWAYSVDEVTHDFRPGHISDVWISGYSDELIEVTLDNDKVIKTTPNHLYMLRNGTYKRADELTVGQSLMPLYFQNNVATNGYDCVKYNSKSHGYNSIYKEVAKYELQEQIEEAKIRSGEDRVAIHHRNFNKLDNRPENLYPMGHQEHIKYHSDYINQRRKEDSEFDKKCRDASSRHCKELNANPTEALTNARKRLGKKRMAEINSDPAKRAEVSKNASDYQKKYWGNMTLEERSKEAVRRHSLDPEMNRKISEGQKRVWSNYSDEEKSIRNKQNGISLNGENGEKASERTRRYWREAKESNPEKYKEYCERNKRNLTKVWETNPERFVKGRARKVLEKIVADNLEMTEANYLKLKPRNAPLPKTCWNDFHDMVCDLGYGNYNHSVKSIRHIKLEKPIPVYDITVDKYSNFLVSAGVILHNCYRFMHYAWKYDYLYGDPTPGTEEPPNITNPDNAIGATCKHLDLFLANKRWLTKAASTVNALIHTYPDKAATYLYDEDEIQEDEPEEDEVVDEVETKVEEEPVEDTEEEEVSSDEEVEETEETEGE